MADCTLNGFQWRECWISATERFQRKPHNFFEPSIDPTTVTLLCMRGWLTNAVLVLLGVNSTLVVSTQKVITEVSVMMVLHPGEKCVWVSLECFSRHSIIRTP